jgi:alkyl hydroperoxide reductase subunit AhpC
MSVFVSKPAPNFELNAYIRGEKDEQRVSLEQFRGKWVVLFFYPRDFTFVCPTEIQAFGELNADFEAENAIVLGASTDSFFSHKAWFESDERLLGVEYPVLADTAHHLARDYGVLLEDGTALRGTFIIDPDGIVRKAEINDLGVGRNVADTLRTLRALRTGDLCPANWEQGERTLSQELEVVV